MKDFLVTNELVDKTGSCVNFINWFNGVFPNGALFSQMRETAIKFRNDWKFYIDWHKRKYLSGYYG